MYTKINYLRKILFIRLNLHLHSINNIYIDINAGETFVKKIQYIILFKTIDYNL